MTKNNNQKNNTPTQNKRQIVSAQQKYSGPIPPPHYLEAYEKIHPGLANRLVQLAKKDAEHVRAVQTKQVEQNGYALKKRSINHNHITMLCILIAFEFSYRRNTPSFKVLLATFLVDWPMLLLFA